MCLRSLDAHIKEKHGGPSPSQPQDSSPPPAKRMKTLVMFSGPGQQDQASSSNLEKVAENILGSMDNFFLNSSKADQSLEMEEIVGEEEKGTHEPDWEEEVEKRLMTAGVLFHCADCKFVHKEESDMVEHIQKTHLPGFPGYKCPQQQCSSQLAGLNQLTTHMQQQHENTR